MSIGDSRYIIYVERKETGNGATRELSRRWGEALREIYRSSKVPKGGGVDLKLRNGRSGTNRRLISKTDEKTTKEKRKDASGFTHLPIDERVIYLSWRSKQSERILTMNDT